MNQREHAAIIVAEIVALIEDVARPLTNATDQLDAIVDKAKNGPPDGEADGSLDERQWAILRDYVTALRGGIAAVEAMR